MSEQLDLFAMFEEVTEVVEVEPVVVEEVTPVVVEKVETPVKKAVKKAPAKKKKAPTKKKDVTPVTTVKAVESDLLIKSRSAKMSTRGIYVQDRELLDTVFTVGSFFDFVIDSDSKKVTVISSDVKTRHTVSKRKVKDVLKPVIDIRKSGVLSAFEGCQELAVNIYNNRIEIIGIK